METPKPSPAGLSRGRGRVIHALLVAGLVLIVIGAVRWRMLETRHYRGVMLYNDVRYKEAIGELEPLMTDRLARIGIRKRAMGTILLCKAHVAANARTIEGYETALCLLAEASAAGFSDEDVAEAVAEYTAYRDDLKRREALREERARSGNDGEEKTEN